MIESVRIDGDEIALADVFASVTLRHGREAVDDEPLGSVATLSLIDVDDVFTAAFRVGRRLSIDVAGDPDPAGNLVLNGTFDVNATGWINGTGGTITRDVTEARDGAASGKIVTAGAVDNEHVSWSSGAVLTIGDRYYFSVWVKAPAGATGYVHPYALVTAQVAFVGTGEWEEIRGSFVPAATDFDFYVATEIGAPAQAITIHVDSVIVSPTPIPFRARFRGRVTDAALNQDDPDEPTLSILAVSTLARISGRKVGAVDWPAESWSDRVSRAFTEAGASADLVLEVGTADPDLAARPAEETTLAEILQELAETVSSAVADLPNGTVLVQAVTSRQGSDPVELDPDLVVLAPEWAQSDDVANVVRVEWSGGTVELQDAGSIALYDERAPLSLSTLLANLSDAEARAALELNRRARPDWRIDHAELLELGLDLGIGSPVLLTELPAASPRPLHIGMLEGWTDHVESIDGELEWTMTLSLSPQRLSGYGLAWEDVPSSILWDDAAPDVTWDEAEQLLA